MRSYGPHLENLYSGSCFLVCSGPSLASHDLSLLKKRGIFTCAVNNAAAIFHPTIWVSADDPGNFCDAIWKDPSILKFVPSDHEEKLLTERDGQETLIDSDIQVKEMPGVFGFSRNEEFNADTFLKEETFNWGNHGATTDTLGVKGSRSVMLIAVKLLYRLGFRKIYLLGCDFKMEENSKNYAFPQDRSKSSVRGNNKTYHALNLRFAALLPYFARAGLEVYNCTPDSGLKAFPYLSYKDAVREALSSFPTSIKTEGMYEHKAGKKRVPNFGDITLMVGVDEKHLEELKVTWPTWIKYKPEVLKMPMRVVCDGKYPKWHWEEKLEFLDRPDVEITLWEKEASTQREKMLTALTYSPESIQTPWYLKLDTDAIAVEKIDWINAEWFKDSPAFISSPWGYTKPADWIDKLDAWAATYCPCLFKKTPKLNLPGEGKECVGHPRITGWCFLGNTIWTQDILKLVPSKELPVPSFDTFLWYCAERKQAPTRKEKFNRLGWAHISNLRRLRERAEGLLK